jgi:hypothetical protein
VSAHGPHRPALIRLVALGALLGAGCIRAPGIVVVDHATALERQAAGRFPDLERELALAGLAPRPSPLSRAELEARGGARATLDPDEAGEAERVDALLTARCVGEARDGLLVATPDSCAVKELPRLSRLLERANRDRQQLWLALAAARPQRSAAEIRQAWRAVHLRAVICGGQVQRDDGAWEVKRC